MRQFLHKKQCVTRKFHVLVVQNGIVVEKTNFGKKLGVRTQLPWQLQLKCFQISFRKSLCAWWSQLKVISLKLFYYQSFFKTWYIALFPRQLEVLVLTQIHQIRNYFPKKNLVLLSNFFSSSNMLFIGLFLANTWEKNRGSPCLLPHKLL